jgi:F-type H+-transporting ATPase subunit b
MEVTGRDLAVIVTNIIGFLLVLAILRRYAWGPLLNFLEDRRLRIADEFKTIDRQKSEVDQLREDFAAKLKEIDALKREKIQEGASEGHSLAESIKADARKEAEDLRERARADAEREYQAARAQLRDYIVGTTLTATEKIIRERLDEEKHRQLIAASIDEMGKA